MAVSGGVDSVVLLHLLATVYQLPSASHGFIVAHFDHGIRSDSAKDREVVEEIARSLNLSFEYEEGKLGKDASEADARDARYKFLRKMLKKYDGDAIITAHHQDDAVETLIINLIRGTGRRGVLKETADIKRPLLNVSKQEIIGYAKENNLKWREDLTNQNNKYLRNYVRNVLIPTMKAKDPDAIEKLLSSSTSLKNLNLEIDSSITDLMEENCQLTKKLVILPRYWLIMTPNSVGKEIIYEAIRHLDKQSGIDKQNLENLLVFAKTAKVHKKTPINANINMRIELKKIIIELV